MEAEPQILQEEKYRNVEPEYMNTHASLLYKVKITQLEMIRDRGYDINDETFIFSSNVKDFIDYYQSDAAENGLTFKGALSKIYINSKTKNKIYVYYAETIKDVKQTGKKQVESCLDILNNYPDIKDVVFISELSLSSVAREDLATLPLYHIDSFLYERLCANPTHHFLVPQHILLSEEDAAKFLKRNDLKFSNLPKITVDDPIAKYYGATPGRIFMIKRKNVTIELLINSSITFRAVIENL